MSKKTIRESLLELDRKFLGTDKYKDLTALYESQEISGNDKSTLKKLINDIKDKEELQNAIISVLQEDVDGDFDYDETSEWEMIDKKSVLDYDGFWTDYSLWHNLITNEWVCIFGDIDLYNPVTTYSDVEFETEDEAREWFEDYNGFVFDDNDLDEGYFRKGSIPLEDDITLQLFNLFAAEGYDTNSPEVDAYISSMAPIIEDDIKHFRKDDGYNVRVWYEETKKEHPEELAKLPKSSSLKEDWQDIYRPYPGADRDFQSLIQNNKRVGYIEYSDDDGDWSYCAYLNISNKNNPTKLEDYKFLGNFKSREEAQRVIENNNIIKEWYAGEPADDISYHSTKGNISDISDLKIGDKIYHSSYGEGIVDDIKDDKVYIIFDNNQRRIFQGKGITYLSKIEKTLSESDTLNDDEFDYFVVYEGEILQGEYPTYFDAKENCKGSSCTIKGVKQYGPNEYEETPLNEDYNTYNYLYNYEIKTDDDWFYIDFPYDLDFYIDIPYQVEHLPNNVEDLEDYAEDDFYSYITSNKICSKISEICNIPIEIESDGGTVTVLIDKDSVNSKESININLLCDTLLQLIDKWEYTDEVVIWGTQRDADDWDEYYGEFSARAYL